MKKIYFLLLTLLISSMSFGQVLITEIADPDNNAEARYIELYNMGATAVDFTEGSGWQIDKYLNGNAGVATTLDLTGTIPAGGFYIIAYDNTPGTFQTVYGFAPDQLDGVNNGVVGSNGDDDLALVNGSDVIVDFFGVYDFGLNTNTDNSGTCAEYEDGRAERLTSVVGPSATFNEAEWNVWADSTIAGCTSHQNAPRNAPGDFDPGAWGTPTCGFSLFNVSSVCDAFTPGTDTYTATIDFSGGGSSPYVVSADSGTVGGDDPALVATGTIIVTGVAEGTDVVVSVTDGGLCDLNSTITSPTCVPSNTLPLYEPFNYAVGSQLIDAPNWSNISTSTDEVLVGGPGGLSYSILDFPSGNHVAFDGIGSDPAVEFTPVTSGFVYASFLFNVTDQTLASDIADGGYFVSLGDNGAFRARLWVRANPGTSDTTFDIGLSNSGATPDFGSTLYNVGETLMVVMSYDTATGNMNAWVNPSEADLISSTAPAATISSVLSAAPGSINQFIIRQDSASETPFILFDELRVGTTWADVTPTTLSNDDFNITNFKIYPNPTATGFVNISSTNTDAMSVAVFDVLGKQVINETISNNRLDVSSLNSGLYIVKISQNNATVTKKLVIK
jgi:hypothetical protein